MKKLYNTPETTLVKTIGSIDMMKFTSPSGTPLEPAPARQSGKIVGSLYI